MPDDGAAAQAAASHGASIPRGLQAARDPLTGRGRFGRMFPLLPAAELADSALTDLVRLMEDRSVPDGENPHIPAGYTYLGQFIDHDITFDPTSDRQKLNDPLALSDFRTPRLDLDSLYGSGPDDQPFLYDWKTGDPATDGAKLLVGASAGAPGSQPVPDLPRNEQGRALIGDPRNDENLIISQLHLLFIQFHNKVVDWVRAQQPGLGGPALFREAQRVVRWHYQWVVIHDFLERVAGPALAGTGIRRIDWCTGREPFMPVEFSVAAYRFGHSMVRSSYKVNSMPLDADPPIFAAEGVDLRGFRRLPAALRIEWEFFFGTGAPAGPKPQPSMLIDTSLSPPLYALPLGVGQERKLAGLNLERGRALGLPSGSAVALALGETPLTPAQLKLGEIADPGNRDALLRAPPLWYYILCEAEATTPGNGRSLGRVGALIVAAVLVGLLDRDPQSYPSPRWPAWRPELGTGGFAMPDLVAFATAPG